MSIEQVSTFWLMEKTVRLSADKSSRWTVHQKMAHGNMKSYQQVEVGMAVRYECTDKTSKKAGLQLQRN